MKTTLKIAKTELQVLFYSPVAWLILVIFTFQASMLFSSIFGESVRKYLLGNPIGNLTLFTFYGNGYRGFFLRMQQYLYLYMPLLTMGVMSRELSSGSIKMLYSSPLTNRQIIFGKYLALVTFGLVITAILGIFGIYTLTTINSVDVPPILSGLLGIFLLICAYAAIGLFMSSITSYTVVAAMGTLAIFALLSYVRNWWQDIEVVRDITYWLAITGRSNTLIMGLITSEDIIYFLVVIGLFLSLCIFRLQAGRQKSPWYISYGKYVLVLCLAAGIGYFSSKPKLRAFYDTSRTKLNTLTENSQQVVAKLDDGLTITTYVNMLEPNYIFGVPTMQKMDIDRFNRYLRFKPDIKLRYKYYYHRAENPDLDKRYPGINDKQRLDSLNKVHNWNFPIQAYADIQNEVDLSGENFRFVRLIERENGEKTFLRVFDDMFRFPKEEEITAALKRLVMELPEVGFLTGHGERGSDDDQDRGYNTFAQEKTFRYALINQGFDFSDVTLGQDIPVRIKILVIAEPRNPLSADELTVLQRYIDRGGNLILAGEPGREDYLNPIAQQIGVRFLPGTLVERIKKNDTKADNTTSSGGGVVIQVNTDNRPLREDTVQKAGKEPQYGSLLTLSPTREATDFSFHLADMAKDDYLLTMPGTSALQVDSTSPFKTTVLFRTDSLQSWNELETANFIDDTVRFNQAAGEEKKAYPTVLALSREINNKEQKILVTGDADWLSNAELSLRRKGIKARNFSLITAAFLWLSDEEVPIDTRRETPPDKSMKITLEGWKIATFCFKWVLPLTLIAIGTIIWIRRRGR